MTAEDLAREVYMADQTGRVTMKVETDTGGGTSLFVDGQYQLSLGDDEFDGTRYVNWCEYALYGQVWDQWWEPLGDDGGTDNPDEVRAAIRQWLARVLDPGDE